jgi:hypothetical protein
MSEGERYGVVGSESGEIFFTESALTSGMPIGRIKIQIKRQNKSLYDVKARMAAEARARGET